MSVRYDAFACRKRLLAAILLAAGALPSPAPSADTAKPGSAQPVAAVAHPRPRIGLVLSGGGARGIAHIGVLKVLEEYRIPVDYIAGTSMGSIVAGCYAAGLSPRQLEERVVKADWNEILAGQPPRQDRSLRSKALERRNVYGVEVGVGRGGFLLPQGAIVGHNLEVFLADTLGREGEVHSFDALPIPYRAVATDIVTGQPVVLGSGSLVDAMRASMSVPGVFAPADIDGHLLLDGGLVRNLPVDVVRGMGAEVVIAVNLGSPLLKRDQITSVLGVTEQMINILTEQNVQQSLSELTARDVLISPELGYYGSGDFIEAARTIPIGETAARKVADRLRALSLSADEYRAFRGAQLARVQRERPIEEVRVDTTGLRFVNPKAVTARTQTLGRDQPKMEEVKGDVSHLLSTEDFQQVRYKFTDVDGKRVLVLEPIEKSWGPNYLRFGLELSTNFSGQSSFDLLVDHRMTWLNRLGLEWRNDVSIGQTTGIATELFQPLSHAHTWFVAPHANWYVLNDNIFFDDQAVAQYTFDQWTVGLDLGYEIGLAGEVRLGYQRGHVSGKPEVGLFFPRTGADIGAVVLRGLLDRLDNWAFPSSGYFTRAEYTVSRQGLGASSDYEQLDIQAQKAFSFGTRHRLVVGGRYATSFGGTSPLYSLFALGGFLNLSGYQPRQFLVDDHLAFGNLIYYYRLGKPGAFTDKLYLGGSLELADIGQRVNGPQPSGLTWGSSLFIGADTALGPLYLAVGAAQDNYALYLFLGKP